MKEPIVSDFSALVGIDWAGQSVRYSFLASAYCDMQINKGKPHNTIIRALAF